MSLCEVVLPEAKPEFEWIAGRAVQKVSPTRDHGRLQMRIASALDAWSYGRGEVATEWRFRLAPPQERRRPLVPDVAYVSYDRLRTRSETDVQTPEFAPNVVVEILSPRDEPRFRAEKVAVYLGCGVELIVEIEPSTRSVTLYDASHTRRLMGDDVLTHAALPGFCLHLGRFFQEALDRPQ
jgi:Uma2 family endonuclease